MGSHETICQLPTTLLPDILNATYFLEVILYSRGLCTWRLKTLKNNGFGISVPLTFKSAIPTKRYWLIYLTCSLIFLYRDTKGIGGSECPDEYYQRHFKNGTPSLLTGHLALLRWIRVTAEVIAGFCPHQHVGLHSRLEYLLSSPHILSYLQPKITMALFAEAHK